jgi:hypothetical protein
LKPETVVKLRDAFALAMDALQEELERMAPTATGEKQVQVPVVLEQTFTILTYEKQSGDKLGEYETATKKNNISEKFQSAYNILAKANGTIAHRYHGESYLFSYWIYDERIFRQKLKK